MRSIYIYSNYRLYKAFFHVKTLLLYYLTSTVYIYSVNYMGELFVYNIKFCIPLCHGPVRPSVFLHRLLRPTKLMEYGE